MSIANQETPVVDEKRWNAWLLKSKQVDLRAQRKIRISAGLLLTMVGIGAAVFLLMK